MIDVNNPIGNVAAVTKEQQIQKDFENWFGGIMFHPSVTSDPEHLARVVWTHAANHYGNNSNDSYRSHYLGRPDPAGRKWSDL